MDAHRSEGAPPALPPSSNVKDALTPAGPDERFSKVIATLALGSTAGGSMLYEQVPEASTTTAAVASATNPGGGRGATKGFSGTSMVPDAMSASMRAI